MIITHTRAVAMLISFRIKNFSHLKDLSARRAHEIASLSPRGLSVTSLMADFTNQGIAFLQNDTFITA